MLGDLRQRQRLGANWRIRLALVSVLGQCDRGDRGDVLARHIAHGSIAARPDDLIALADALGKRLVPPHPLREVLHERDRPKDGVRHAGRFDNQFDTAQRVLRRRLVQPERGQQHDPFDAGPARIVEQGADIVGVLRARDGAGDQVHRVHALPRGLIGALIGPVEADRLDARARRDGQPAGGTDGRSLAIELRDQTPPDLASRSGYQDGWTRRTLACLCHLLAPRECVFPVDELYSDNYISIARLALCCQAKSFGCRSRTCRAGNARLPRSPRTSKVLSCYPSIGWWNARSPGWQVSSVEQGLRV